MAGYNKVPERNAIKIGATVQVAKKENYENGIITTGVVQDILTSRPEHPRGIKVRLTTGEIGRVQALGNDPIIPLEKNEVEPLPDLPSNYQYEPNDDDLV